MSWAGVFAAGAQVLELPGNSADFALTGGKNQP
jgi:hypothetical protein